MIRTQIQLTEEQLERLRDLAAAEGRSMADVIRESVDRYLDEAPHAASPEELRERGKAIAGRFSSGIRDLAAKHDRHLAEIFRK